MSLIKMYYYWFYKYYRLFEYFKGTRWLTDFKAMVVIMALEIWTLLSFVNYYSLWEGENKRIALISPGVLIPFVLILGTNLFAFVFDEHWREEVEEFDKWPVEKNRVGSWIVVFFTLFLVANFCFSIYLNPPIGGVKW